MPAALQPASLHRSAHSGRTLRCHMTGKSAQYTTGLSRTTQPWHIESAWIFVYLISLTGCMSAPCQRFHQVCVLYLQMEAVQAALMQGPGTCMIHACEGPIGFPTSTMNTRDTLLSPGYAILRDFLPLFRPPQVKKAKQPPGTVRVQASEHGVMLSILSQQASRLARHSASDYDRHASGLLVTH
jgi:hypothetical protein